MTPSVASPPHPAPALTDHEERIRHLPAAARVAFRQYQVDGNPSNLSAVVFAILEDYVPSPPSQPLADMPGTTRLMGDLGFDSLAITEVVFFVEDLFEITVTNKEIVQIRSLDDLRGFISRKVDIRQVR